MRIGHLGQLQDLVLECRKCLRHEFQRLQLFAEMVKLTWPRSSLDVVEVRWDLGDLAPTHIRLNRAPGRRRLKIHYGYPGFGAGRNGLLDECFKTVLGLLLPNDLELLLGHHGDHVLD